MAIKGTIKQNGQVFTPPFIVDLILESMEYDGIDIIHKKILEPSFGQGIFILKIIDKYIDIAKQYHIDNIEEYMNKNIYGIELNEDLYQQTKILLNDYLSKNGLKEIEWKHLYNEDTLMKYQDFINYFDYIVGNPPYVRVHNFSDNVKEHIKDLEFIDGDTDLYICFYEMSIKMLKQGGKLGFITPNSFLKNSSQKKFRNYLLKNKLVDGIFDFGSSKVFKGYSTYTCIALLSKVKEKASFEYREYEVEKEKVCNTIYYKDIEVSLLNKPWQFSSKENMDFLNEIKCRKEFIKNIAIVQNGIATNNDKIFINKVYEDKENTKKYYGKHFEDRKIVYFNGYEIESDILRRCVKESKYNGIMDNLYVLFPYYKKAKGENFVPIDERVLKEKYPKAYKYLKDNYNDLLNRDMDKNAKWYVFGRSQGLLNMESKKIIFKHIINKTSPSIIPYILDEDIVVYSGIYTIPNNYSINKLIHIFQSKDFEKYVTLVGKDMSGGYITISTKNVSEYGIK